MATDLDELHGKLWEAIVKRCGCRKPIASVMVWAWGSLRLSFRLSAGWMLRLRGASTEEVRDDDGVLVGWWAENPECKGASAFGATPDEARSKLRQVLVDWVGLGQQLGHPIPSFHNGIIAAPQITPDTQHSRV